MIGRGYYFCCYCLPREIIKCDVFTAFIPSEFEIFEYKDFTSSDTRYELSGFYCL